MDTILIILGSSLVTLIVSKFWETYAAKKIFDRDLKKLYFTKKIDALIDASSFCLSVSTNYSMIQSAIRLYLDGGNENYCNSMFIEAQRKDMLLLHESDKLFRAIFYIDINDNERYKPNNRILIAENLSALQNNRTERNKTCFKCSPESIKKLDKEYNSLLENLYDYIEMEKQNINYKIETIRKIDKKYKL